MLCAPWPGGFCEGLILGFYCELNRVPSSLRFGATGGPKSAGRRERSAEHRSAERYSDLAEQCSALRGRADFVKVSFWVFIARLTWIRLRCASARRVGQSRRAGGNGARSIARRKGILISQSNALRSVAGRIL